MAEYDWFEEWDAEDSNDVDDYSSDESLLEGWIGYAILFGVVIGLIGGLLQALWKPALAFGVLWLGYESLQSITEYVQGVF